MCTVSMVITDFEKRWPNLISPSPGIGWPPAQVPWTPAPHQTTPFFGVSRDEFDALKAEVEALRGLLAAAKKFDDETGQHDCEQAEKVALLKRVAELVGVDISDVLA